MTAPGELGFARAYVAGDLDIEGDLYEALELLEHHLEGLRTGFDKRDACSTRSGSSGVNLQ